METYTKQALSETRYKLKPEAFTDLNHVLIENFYADSSYRTVANWIPVAIDGSVLEIPNTPPPTAAPRALPAPGYRTPTMSSIACA